MKKQKQFLRNVVMIMACLAVTVVFSNCDSGNSGNSGSKKMDVIKASQLISKAEAEDILELNVTETEIKKSYFTDEVAYRTAKFYFPIALWQESLHDKTSDYEKNLLKNGWKSYLKDMEKNLSEGQEVVNVGDGKAYLQDAYGVLMIHIFYDDFLIQLSLINVPYTHEDTDDEAVWKRAKIKEAGTLAVKNLKSILK